MAERELSDIEKELQARFNPSLKQPFTSTVGEAKSSSYIKQLALPDESRGRIPITQEKFIIQENPARVEWEREIRKFLDALYGEGGHRITAPMVFEWVTGIPLKALIEAEGAAKNSPKGGGQNGSANSHLRHINWVLKEYFGTPYKTTIANVPVGKAYTVHPGFRISRKAPAQLALWPEWNNGTLRP